MSSRPRSFSSPSAPVRGAGAREKVVKNGASDAWARIGIERDAAVDGGDAGGWLRAVCPKCRPTLGAASCLRLLDEGPGLFACARCGWQGDLEQGPHRLDLDAVAAWWHEMSAANAPEGLGEDTVQALLAEGAVVGQNWMGLDDKGCWTRCVGLPAWVARKDGGRAMVDICWIDAEDPAALERADVAHERISRARHVALGADQIDGGQVVFVDHPLDWLALRACGVEHAACLPDTIHDVPGQIGDWSFMAEMETAMQGVGRVVIAMRNTSVGHRLEEELARRMGVERCFRIRWQGIEVPAGQVGAWTVWRAHGAGSLTQCVVGASPYPVKGVHELADVDDAFEVLYEFGLAPGVSTGWPSLDDYYTVKSGQMTIVTGIPGHGKSNFLDALFVNIAEEHDWVFGIFSPENQPIERHYANLMEKYVGAPFSHGPTPRITPHQKTQAKAWLNEHFKIILPDDESGNWTIDGVLALAKMLVYRHGIRGLIIDPWNELDHTRPGGMTETDHISAALTKIRRFARINGVHVWVVAHPTKLEPKADGEYPVPTPYMISGGAHWRNKADNALTVFRNVGREDDDISDIHVQKIRFKEVGRVGRVALRYDVVCGRYIDDIDQEKRRHALKTGTTMASRLVRLNEPRARRTTGGVRVEYDDNSIPDFGGVG